MGKSRKRARVLAPRPPVETIDEVGKSKFARALGSSDFHTRERGLEALTSWLSGKASVHSLSLDKIWKGILFCFWHSDKAPVQQDLANRLAAIMTAVHEQVAAQYFGAFLRTMMQNWSRIDRLRIDKFMMLVRVFLRQALGLLAAKEWEKATTSEFAALFAAHAFHVDDAVAPVGFSLHIVDIFVSELLSSTEEPIPWASLSCLLGIFVTVLQQTRQPALQRRTQENVFGHLIEELSAPSGAASGGPHVALRACRPGDLSDVLFQAGAAQNVRTTNRAALYELSQRLEGLAPQAPFTSKETCKQKAQFAAGESVAPVQGPADGPHAARDEVALNYEQGQQSLDVQAAPKQASKKKHSKSQKIGVAAAGVASAKKCLKSTQIRKAASVQRNGDTAVVSAHANKSESRSERKRKRGDDPGAHGEAKSQADEPGSNASAAAVVREDAARRLGTKTLVNGHGGARTNGKHGSAIASKLTAAVAKVQATALQRRISFDLAKNVYCEYDSPPPAPHIRTPPSSKPRGSALKVSSAVVARRLPFTKGKRHGRKSM